MNIFAGSIEIQMLWSVVLGLAQLIVATPLRPGIRAAPGDVSPRDGTPPPVSAVTARLKRAFNNFRETFGFFAVAVLAVVFSGEKPMPPAPGARRFISGRGWSMCRSCRGHHRLFAPRYGWCR